MFCALIFCLCFVAATFFCSLFLCLSVSRILGHGPALRWDALDTKAGRLCQLHAAGEHCLAGRAVLVLCLDVLLALELLLDFCLDLGICLDLCYIIYKVLYY